MTVFRMWTCFALLVFINGVAAMKTTAQDVPKSVPEKKADKQEVSVEKLYWIFLTTGRSTEGVNPEEVAEMQRTHLGNFKKLAGEGKLLTAGPMNDPEERLRGIVVVKAKNRSALEEYFNADPYVTEGYLKIEATEMEFEHGIINTKITPQGLEEFRLVVFEAIEGKTMGSELKSANEKFIGEMSKNEGLRLAVYLNSVNFKRAALMIMSKPEDEQEIKIDEQIKNIPAIKSGNWKPRVFPLYMGKGSLDAAS